MKKLGLGCFILLLLLLLIPRTASAAWGESVYPKEQELNTDLIKANDKVIIDTTVHGDVLAAGSTVRNSGHITNDLLALGYYLHHQGRVEGSARFVGKTLIVDGSVEKNLTALSFNQTYNTDSIIKGNLIAVGKKLTFNGRVTGKAIIRGDEVTIGGELGPDVEIYANRLIILPRAKFTGAITYFGPQEASVSPTAKFTSPLIYKPTAAEKGWQTFAYHLLGLLILGGITAALLPKLVLTTAQKLIYTPGRNFMFGSLFLVLLPLVCLILAWFKPGRISALAFGTAALGLATALLYLAQVFWGSVLGKLLWSMGTSKLGLPGTGPNLSVMLQTVLGTIVVGLVCQIPYLGILVSLSMTISCCGLVLVSLFTDARWKTTQPLTGQATGA